MKKIFEPITINGMTLANRMIASAMVTNFANTDGTLTERFIAYHEAKAKGGWGLIIPENYQVTPDAGASKALPGLYDDALIASHSLLTRRVHQAGSKLIAQLYHAGQRTNSTITGVAPISASAIAYEANSEVPREMTLDEISDLVNRFGDAALRAKKAGYDGVEIHGAHGYLVSAFVSPHANKRQDGYGGTISNRARFALEIIENIRKKVGAHYPIFYRMSTDEYIDGGLTIEEAKVLAMLLEEAGVDAIHCSQGGYDAGGAIVIPPAIVPRGHFTDNAAAIKSVVAIPVIAVGRINDPLLAESILVANKADLVSMARASLADPELPQKAAEGRCNEILHCIGCVQGCKTRDRGCLVNPMTGHEFEYDLSPAPISKKIFIAGGGISGCEAAIVAAKKGHHVHLFEKAPQLGGQWRAAAIPVGKDEFASFLFWQSEMIKKLGIEVHLNRSLTKEIVEQKMPDAVLIATGGYPVLPPITGIDSQQVCFAIDVLEGKVAVGTNVVVVGGGLVGAETADHLALHGHQVSLVEMLPEIMKDGELAPTLSLKERLKKQQAAIYTSAKVMEIDKNTVTINQRGTLQILTPVDTLVVAVGMRSETALLEALKDYQGQVIAIGDARSVKNGLHNIREGFSAGMSI